MHRRFLWFVLVIAALASVVTVAIPTWHIQPFAPQTTRGMAWSYALRQAAPIVTAVGMTVVLLSAVALLWVGRREARRTYRRPRGVVRRWAPRVVLVTLVAATGLVTWFARQNHFEWMFAPLPRPEFVSFERARMFLVDDEIVMGVTADGVSRAYPIRQLAYHHLVNDRIGRAPVVVTY